MCFHLNGSRDIPGPFDGNLVFSFFQFFKGLLKFDKSSTEQEPCQQTPGHRSSQSGQSAAWVEEYFSRRQQPTLDSLIFDKSKDGLGSSPSKFRSLARHYRTFHYVITFCRYEELHSGLESRVSRNLVVTEKIQQFWARSVEYKSRQK